MIKIIFKFLFDIFPIFKFKIKESSMESSLMENDAVLVSKFSYIFGEPQIGDIVVLKFKKRYIIKRIAKKEQNKYFVLGDNLEESIDSRKFGWISKKDIVGKVIWVFG